MRKLYLILIMVIVASVAAYYFHQHKSSTLRNRDSDFSIHELEEIDRITLTSGNNSISLYNELGSWKVNNEVVNQERMTDFLILATKLEAVFPASKAEEDELSAMLNDGTEVAYYSGRKRINSYRICKWKMKIFATRGKSDKIFQVEARGYPNVDLTKVFTSETAHWKNRKIINFHPKEIQSVKIHYPCHSNKNFEIRQVSSGNYRVSDQKNNDFTRSADQDLIRIYLHFFCDITYISVQDQEKANASYLKEPFFILAIETYEKSRIELHGYRKMNPENEKTDVVEFYGELNKTESMLLKYSDFDPILVDLDYFLKK